MHSKSRVYGDEGLFLGPILGTKEKTPALREGFSLVV